MLLLGSTHSEPWPESCHSSCLQHHLCSTFPGCVTEWNGCGCAEDGHLLKMIWNVWETVEESEHGRGNSRCQWWMQLPCCRGPTWYFRWHIHKRGRHGYNGDRRFSQICRKEVSLDFASNLCQNQKKPYGLLGRQKLGGVRASGSLSFGRSTQVSGLITLNKISCVYFAFHKTRLPQEKQFPGSVI